MGSLNPVGELSAASLAFFCPALLIALYINFRHGFSKRLGWFYIIILSVLRIIGASCILYIQTQNNYSIGVETTAAITTAAGMAPLLLALLGFLERVNSGIEEIAPGKGFSHGMVFRPIHLIALAGLIMAIIGGVDLASASGPKDSDFSTGHHLMQAGACVFTAILVAIAVINVVFFLRREYVIPSERKLVYVGLPALPFLLVRIAYAMIIGFSTSPSDSFYYTHVSVWAEAFMRFMPEAVVVLLYIVAGLMTPKREVVPPPPQTKEVELEDGTVESRQQRSLGDYRPSRLVMNAYRQHQAKRAEEA